MHMLSQNDIFIRIEQDLSILNSRLIGIQIEYIENTLRVSIRLKLNNSMSKKLFLITFRHVKEYSFAYSSNHSFYNVENYKFTVSQEGVFLSLDPADDSVQRVTEDQDYILAGDVIGFVDV